MQQGIRFCRSADGVRLAYATAGQGPPLVKAASHLTHLEHEWESPVWRHWLHSLAADHTLVRYDERGCGLSDRDVEGFGVEAGLADLEAVVEAAGNDRFDLLGIAQGASASVAYAARHPERVRHLILYGGYARGRLRRARTDEERVEAETLINVIRVGWSRENPAFRQLFSTQLMPDGSDEQMRWLDELARISARPETTASMERASHHIDVSELAPRVRVPTLVLHARADAAIPFEAGRQLASLIPEARFVPLEGRNHVLLEDEPAWTRFLSEVRAFLGETETRPSTGRSAACWAELTPREASVLDGLARGWSNDEIAEHLRIRSKTVRNHVSRIYDKLGVSGRPQAIVVAREAGLGLD